MMAASNGLEADGIVIATTGNPVSSLNMLVQDVQQQALTGTVNLAVSGSNASFSLLLDADSVFVKLTNVSTLNVYQVSTTELKGISSVAQGTKVRVRGLLLFDGTNYQFVAARITQP